MRKMLLVAIATLAMTACGDSTGPGVGSVPGTYHLQTVNGANLPFTLIELGEDRLDVVSGSITLNANLTYTIQIGYLETVGGVSTPSSDSTFGTYTETNGALRMIWGEDGSLTTGAVGDGTLTLGEATESLVFRK